MRLHGEAVVRVISCARLTSVVTFALEGVLCYALPVIVDYS